MYKDILDPHQICLSKIVGLFCILNSTKLIDISCCILKSIKSIEFKTCIIHGKSKLYTCKEPEYDRSPLMIRLLLCPSFSPC